MSIVPAPSAENAYLAEHIALLRKSYRHYTGRELVDVALDPLEAAQQIYDAPFVVVSHNTDPDPIFNYANRMALSLFEMDWAEFTALPSRQSAEPPNQAERARLLEAVTTQGYIDGYSGVRISHSGKRFLIQQVTVWNLLDQADRYYGQAAVYSQWMYL